MEYTIFEKAINLINKANQEDPNKDIFEGKEYPKEYLYSKRMSHCLINFDPEASEALRLAAHAQHICRWEIPRKSFPMNKVGYHEWRNKLKKYHAEKTSEILKEVGYSEETINKVGDLLQKKKLKKDPETQTLEDVICLVFIEFYLEGFNKHTNEEKMIDILKKTWKKMSKRGQETALLLSLPEHISSLISKALT